MDRLTQKVLDLVARENKWNDLKIFIHSFSNESYAITSNQMICACWYKDEFGKNIKIELLIKKEKKETAGIYFQLGFYQTEVEFYKWSVTQDLCISIPNCYYASYNEKEENMIIVMAYLANCDVIKQIVGLPSGKIKKLVRLICKFHNKYFDKGEEILFRYSCFTDEIIEFYRGDFIHNYKLCIKEFGQYLPRTICDRYDVMIKHFQTIFKRSECGPCSLIHFDLRLDNFLFNCDTGGVTVLDWQMARYGNISWDLVILIVGNLREVSAEGVYELLEYYYDNSKIKKFYKYDEFLQDFVLALVHQIIREICYLGDISCEYEERMTYAKNVTVRYSKLFDEIVDENLRNKKCV